MRAVNTGTLIKELRAADARGSRLADWLSVHQSTALALGRLALGAGDAVRSILGNGVLERSTRYAALLCGACARLPAVTRRCRLERAGC